MPAPKNSPVAALPIEPAADDSALVADAPAEVLAADPGRFQIDSERAADWLLGKFAGIDAEIARIEANAARRVKELQADRARLDSLFGAQLRAWAEGEAEKRRRRTVTLLNGVCVFRTVPAGFRLVDADAALPHAHALGLTTVETVTKIDTRAYVKRAEETGEVLPGVEAVPARESFKVEAGPAK